MALQITPLANANEEQSRMKADRRLCLNRDRDKLVEDGDRAAAILFATPGDNIPAADVERLGLVMDADGRVSQASETPEPPPEVKEQPKPEDKQIAKPATKRVTKKAAKTTKKKKATKRRSKG